MSEPTILRFVNPIFSDDAEPRVSVQVRGRVSSLWSQLCGHGADTQADPRHPLQVRGGPYEYITAKIENSRTSLKCVAFC